MPTQKHSDDIQITNCHVHTFTNAHVPAHFPSRFLRIFRRLPILVRGVAGLARLLGQLPLADKLDRLYRFQQEAGHTAQRQILEGVRKHYPGNTRFVILPMDMAGIGHGPVPWGVRDQHDELHALSLHPDHKGTVLPFATVNPLADGSVEEGLRALDRLGFRGLKIYPRMGFAPDHPDLMNRVYPRLVALNRPVMTHCSRGGVQGAALADYHADRFTEPAAYIPVMMRHPDLRICLAHFGGQRDWQAYANARAPVGDDNWQVRIRRMIGSGDWPNLWTDISYTLFHFDDFIPFLRIFLTGEDAESERLRARVLFGSDYYMTRQEKLSERAVCFRLRNALGDEVFRQIAEENPRIWLGESP